MAGVTMVVVRLLLSLFAGMLVSGLFGPLFLVCAAALRNLCAQILAENFLLAGAQITWFLRALPEMCAEGRITGNFKWHLHCLLDGHEADYQHLTFQEKET